MALLKSLDVGSVETSLLLIPAAGLGCIATKLFKGFLNEAGTSCNYREVLVSVLEWILQESLWKPSMALLKSLDVGSVETSTLLIPAAGLGCIATKVSKEFLDEADTSCNYREVLVFVLDEALCVNTDLSRGHQERCHSAYVYMWSWPRPLSWIRKGCP